MGHDWCIDEIKKSGLRGRGGAGFPLDSNILLCQKSLMEDLLTWLSMLMSQSQAHARIERS